MKTFGAQRFSWLWLFLLCAPHLVTASEIGVRIINGKPVEAGTYKEVPKISANGASCTATVIGPRVIVTAAHCANNDVMATFTIDGVNYSAKMKRSSLYPGQDHDIALGFTDKDIKVTPVSVGGKAVVGLGITLLGYGCTNAGGTGGNDGVLRIGDTVITSFSEFDMVSRKADGAALCFGDSGGPAFMMDGSKRYLIGVNSKGNIKDTNWNLRTDIPETQTFMKSFASTNGVVICGINSDCGSDPTPPAPTCSLAANPNKIKLGQSTMLTLMITGTATSATIEGQVVTLANPQWSLTPAAKGVFTARGMVSGPGGSSSCQTTYTVEDGTPPPEVPTCQLAAIPSVVKVGENVTLELTTMGKADKADIDGTPVSIPVGQKMLIAAAKGSYQVKGTVTGAAGSNTCWASYSVEDGPVIPPSTPNLAVVPTYCGENTLPTQVKKVCLAVIKKDGKMIDLRLTEALSLTYQDGSREVLPVISRRAKPKNPGEVKVQEEMTVYANSSVTAETFQVLDSREAVLTKMPPARRSRFLRLGRDAEVPAQLEGRSAKGQYFIIEELKPYAVSE